MSERVAFCIRGLHDYFTESKDNLISHMITPLKEKFDVDIILHTYVTPMLQNIVDFLNPIRCFTVPMRYGDSTHDIVPFQIQECCDLVYDIEKVSNLKYNYIIITRFDLLFNETYDKYDIQYDKINMECLFNSGYNSGDNFILFRRDKLDNVKLAVETCIKKHDNSHQLFRYFQMLGCECHYICGETDKRNPYYDVMFRFTRYIHPKNNADFAKR